MNLPQSGTLASRRSARTLFVLVSLLAVAAVVGPTWLLHHRYDQAHQDFQGKLERFQRIAAQHGEYAKALDELKTRNGRRFYLKAKAANLAGAEVQELVRSAVESHGARLGSIQIGQTREEGGHRAVPVTVQLTANVQSLPRLLHMLETQTPFLFVDQMTLRTAVFRGFRPNPGVEPDINVQLEVSGFIAGGGS